MPCVGSWRRARAGILRREAHVTPHEPERQDLFEAQAAPLYDEIVADGGIKVGDPRIAEDSPSA